MTAWLCIIFIPLSWGANNLGTSAKAAGNFIKNYRTVVVQAFPTYRDLTLQQKLATIARKHRRGHDPLTIKSFRSLQEFFKFPIREISPKETYIEEEKKFAYELDRRTGRLYMHKNLEKTKPLQSAVTNRLLSQVKSNHAKLIKKLGLSANNQILFSDTSMMLIQAMPAEGGNTRLSPPSVDVIFTYALRQLEGVMVEGSLLRLNSKNSTLLEGVAITWPRFQFPRGLKNFKLKSKTILLEEIYQEVKKTMLKGDKINVKMAVVLRPVHVARQLRFIPAMKVGVHSAQGEAGNLFYVDLLSQRVPYETLQGRDTPEG